MSIFDFNIIEQIKLKYETLRKSEKRVADYVINNPERIPNMTIVDLANTCDVSEATVNRFNKMIGIDRFSDLKIATTVGVVSDMNSSIECLIEEGDATDVICSKLANSVKNVIKATNCALSVSTIDIAVKMICEARSILFSGLGGSKVSAETATNLFGKAGFSTLPSPDVFSQYILASKLERADLLVAICLSGRSRDILNIIQIAKDRGAKVIVLSRSQDSPAALAADVSLVTYSVAEAFMGNMIDGKFSQLFVIDMLYTCSVMQRGEEVKESLQRAGKAIHIYNKQ